MAGKGSRQRPCMVPYEVYSANYDAIFRTPRPGKDDLTHKDEEKQSPEDTLEDQADG